MARDKSVKSNRDSEKPERAEPVKPMPFPGESPTVSLALAAAQKYGLQPEDQKPASAKPKRSKSAKARKPTRAKVKSAAPRKSSAKKPVRKASAR